jgi:hypothetical protein
MTPKICFLRDMQNTNCYYSIPLSFCVCPMPGKFLKHRLMPADVLSIGTTYRLKLRISLKPSLEK